MALFSRQQSPELQTTATPTIPATRQAPAPAARPATRNHLGWIVTASLAIGIGAAVFLVAAPFISVTESSITGAVLCGFAVGWAALLLLTRRLTDQPQEWAVLPAGFMGLGGLLLLAFGSPMRGVLSWVWPPALLALVVWMAVSVRRDMRSRAGRVQLYAVFTLLALCAVGGGWQTVRDDSDTNLYLESGRLIDVGGHQLRLDCVGSGSPTVVLEPGAGGTSATMGWITPAVASHTRVCVYDRAGRGGSEAADRRQDGARIATDLHTLLHRADVPGPYVLAGHSFGGLYAQIFAAHYPDEVAGLVLIDSTAPKEPAASVIPATRSESSDDAVDRVATVATLAARVGLARLYGEIVGGGLPNRSEDQLRTDIAQPSTVRSVVEEFLRGGDTAQQAASLRDLGDKPLVVVTAGVGHDQSWMTAQDEMATLSINSAHRVVEGASHAALVDSEHYAAYSSQAVIDVVTSIRRNQPISPRRTS